jgi:transposase InsO family protein
MREDNLLCLKKKFKPVTTHSSHGLAVYPSLLKNTQIFAPNQVWASDITYVLLLHEHIYPAVIIDLYSRKCIVWDLSRNMDRQLTMNALGKALKIAGRNLNLFKGSSAIRIRASSTPLEIMSIVSESTLS